MAVPQEQPPAIANATCTVPTSILTIFVNKSVLKLIRSGRLSPVPARSLRDNRNLTASLFKRNFVARSLFLNSQLHSIKSYESVHVFCRIKDFLDAVMDVGQNLETVVCMGVLKPVHPKGV